MRPHSRKARFAPVGQTATGDQRLPAAAAWMVFASGSVTGTVPEPGEKWSDVTGQSCSCGTAWQTAGGPFG